MSETAPPLINLEDVTLAFTGTSVLEKVSFSVSRGEVVTLIGPNGAGKSTVMKIALGLLVPDQGRVERMPGITIGYMPQKIQIEDILPLTVHQFMMLRPGTTEAQARDVMKLVRISHVAKHPVQRVSGGEMQRVLMARALLGRPDLIVLDEPVQGIDITGQEELYRLIGRIRDDINCGVLMISHDLHMVMAGTDKVVCLNRHICCSGTPETVQHDPEYHALLGHPVEGAALYTHHHDHHHDSHGNVVGGDHGKGCHHD
ncbi:zinc ABC transporter ATP-binding protein ZnuC [Paremcibacter congregatus]|uniref:Zinc ABC transporter ATP-binding protein ZnuC n=1 Tax=Paremcibacter congregatus TaxID=2043170 RepID=A0A2G4YM65_9PROT|nr:zinc ABC transporter ATP-binding protein ZnuC [Paremcibacter congregatus]PHZ83388.1 zinc ABC transporter ATP-binding protein ZnuC [Paremcibacter congregatus]QDE28142.1 zinc ABC transporter ATP-binding protein ZnuC [Paremcibacter congregatus]